MTVLRVMHHETGTKMRSRNGIGFFRKQRQSA